MAQKQYQKLGETVWGKMAKVNTELFTLTYGAMVSQVTIIYFSIHTSLTFDYNS